MIILIYDIIYVILATFCANRYLDIMYKQLFIHVYIINCATINLAICLYFDTI